MSHYPHLEPLCGHKTAQQFQLCKTNPLFVFIAMRCLVGRVWVCWIQFKVVIIIEGLSAWQMPLFMDFFCPNAHEYAVMTRSAQYQYFVIDLTSIILFALLFNTSPLLTNTLLLTNTNINYFNEGLININTLSFFP